MQNIFFKRWLCSLLLLCFCIRGQSQSLKKIEYFFDTDPGIGNGIAINISLSPSILDTTFTFNVSSLTNGLHTVYIRAQDDNLKWSLNYATSFLKTTGAGGVLAISRLEYFFDTDPGVGNATTLNVLQSNTVDSTFTFDVSGLNNGLHIIYVRAIDVNGDYSINYTTSFVRSTGTDSVLTVNKLEYFVDTDPGFGNGINIPIQQAPVVSDTFNFQIPDNGADGRRLYVRAKDNKGQWSLLYDTTVDLCQLYKARPNFGWVRFADSYSFIDSTQNNPSHKLLWNFNDLGIDSVSNPQFTFPQGNHFVKLVAGTGCRKDSVILPLFTGLEKYYPDTAVAGGDIFVNFYGGGLDTNVIVTLKKDAVSITPYAKIAGFQQFFTGAFDLHTAAPGSYDINLHFPNGYDTTIIGGMKVGSLPPGTVNYSPEIKLSILGPEVGRANTTVTQRLVITNTGGMVVKSVPVWIAAQNDAEFAPGPEFKTYQQPDNQLDYQDSIPTEIGLDSLLGEPYAGKLHNFMIPALNAGESFVYSYTLKVPLNHGEVNYVDFWVGKRMFGSPYEWDCIHQSIDDAFNIVGLVPVIGCGFGVAGFGIDFVSGMLGRYGWNTDESYKNLATAKQGSFLYGVASAAFGCIPGAKYAEEATKIAIATTKGVNFAKKSTDVFKVGADALLPENPCLEKNDPLENYRKGIRGRVAADPNGINGPGGYGDNNYITGLGKQGYEVFFENQPTATANAQRIYVADTLEKTKFDLSSFELIGFSIADSFFQIPYQRKEFTTTMDLRPGMNLLLRVNAKLDTATGILNYSFLSLDPATRDTLPLSDIRGFLPPDINDINGKGSISYVVNYKKDRVTNDVVTNNASIVFDNNAPIITNTWLNTIDRTAPVGGVLNGVKINDTTVRLNLGGNDIGAGINKYRLYTKENDKPYVYSGFVTGDTIRFTGTIDSTYSFYAIPYDSVNNFSPKGSADYTITLRRSAYVSSSSDYFRSATSGTWNNPATWESSPDNINFHPATLSPDSAAKAINIRNAHTVTITADVIIDQTIVNSLGTLVVNGSTLTVANNGLILASDSLGTARIGSSTGTILGNVKVERYIPSNGKREWRLLSVPTISSQTTNAAWQNSQTPGVAGITGIGTMITSNNGNVSFDYQTSGNSMLVYNPGNNTWNGIASTTSIIASDNGYMLFVRGDRNATPSNNLVSSTTLTTTGLLKQGNYPASPISVTAGKFASLGNPYASEIDFRNVMKGVGIDNTFYVWDPKLTGSYGLGAYQTLTLNNGNYIITPGGGSYGSAGSVMNTIESGQAFFVHSTSTDNISFTENAKSPGNNMVFRIATVVPKSLITNLYSVEAGGDNLADGTMLLLDNNYSNAVDGLDALKLENFGLNLGMVRNGKILSIEKRQSLSSSDTIFFSLANAKQQQYHFEFIANSLQAPGLSAWLIDKYLNTTTPIDLNGNTNITFEVNADTVSAYVNRFSIVFSKPSMQVNNKSSIVIYPNPVQNGLVKVQLNNMPKGNYAIRLLNSIGQVVFSKQLNHAEGTATESIELNKIKGIYLLEVMKPDSSKTISKLIIN